MALRLDLSHELLDARVDVAVPAAVDAVVEEQMPAGPDERAPAVEVGASHPRRNDRRR